MYLGRGQVPSLNLFRQALCPDWVRLYINSCDLTNKWAHLREVIFIFWTEKQYCFSKCINLIMESMIDSCFPCVKWTAEVETIDIDRFHFCWTLKVTYHYYTASQILINLAFFFFYFFFCLFFNLSNINNQRRMRQPFWKWCFNLF